MATAEEHFAAKVIRSDGCWLWAGSHSATGYGRFQYKGHIYAHRAAWTFAYGPIPEGLDVCHHCDDPGCVRPDHLFIGTARDNMADRDRKGRMATRSGEDSPTGKLTWWQVREIRDLARRGRSQRSIASEYNVSSVTVHKIVTGRAWRE